MRAAVAQAAKGVATGAGGPFGAVVVHNGEIVGRGHNRVVSAHDPTAHAEVEAIRAACTRRRTFSLAGCEIYTTCEPCPMCLGAIYWARLDRIYYGCTRYDAAAIGFDDAFLYEELLRPLPERTVPIESLLRAEALTVFERWQQSPKRTPY